MISEGTLFQQSRPYFPSTYVKILDQRTKIQRVAKTETISKDVAKNIFEEEEDIRSFWLFFTKRVEENLSNLSQTQLIGPQLERRNEGQ